jgi:tetratricopeptide (TPR) repeat protein
MIDTGEEIQLGEARYRAGAWAEAAAIFTRIAEQDPEHSTALRLLGLCRLRLGDLAAALALLERAYALAPADPFAQLHLGLGLHALGRDTEAAALFRRCQPLLPDEPAPPLNLAAALLALGEHRQALKAARQARRRARAMPESHYTLGMVQLAFGELDAAEASFREALRLAPNFADAWVNFGLVRYRRDDIEAAKTAMRRALAAVPGHRAAAANLGAFLRLTGEAEAGEELLRDLLVRDPDAAEARLNLAADLLQEERPAEALALLDERPTPAEPRLARHWLLQRSLALLQQARADEARAVLAAIGDVPRELRPLLLWRRVLLASADRDLAGARALAGEMGAALDAGPAILPEHRIMAHFDLAKFWSRQDEEGRAFPHWREGHRLLGRMQPFSRDTHRRFVEALINCFDWARMQTGACAQNRDPAPVFIVGMPRSGTTLAEQIIAAHPQALGAGERPALGQAWHALGCGEGPDAPARIAALGQPALDQAAASYLAELHALAPDATRVVDKMPGNFNYLGLAALLLPGARIIHCARDPRDIGLSIFTFRFFGHHPYAHDLANLGWYIAQHERLMAHWREALPNPLLTVQLSDWVEDFVGTLCRVLEFLDLPYDAACERFYEQDSRVRTVSRTQVRQPVNARGLDRWRPYAHELGPLIAELATAGLI